jgi:hypothetical protein
VGAIRDQDADHRSGTRGAAGDVAVDVGACGKTLPMLSRTMRRTSSRNVADDTPAGDGAGALGRGHAAATTEPARAPEADPATSAKAHNGNGREDGFMARSIAETARFVPPVPRRVLDEKRSGP